MKIKFLVLVVLLIFVGFLTGKELNKVVNNYQENNGFKGYFLEVDSNTKVGKLEDYIITNDKKSYIGITSSKDSALKLKKILSTKNIKVSIKRKSIDNVEFYRNLEQYDLLLKEVEKDEDAISINKVILSSYDEMVVGNL